ncbi:MAG: hypothetical protein KKE37_02170, partial [Verrucomicrobia bacterium]|nr:hypothetical protein [Verrucomicrobiota bacterium]MBU4292058.1 hypothetical protein [Verrucomicrobiota bacterium]MBU4428143.1 hypothetical protein [Verrucomicrobiota bacterium]MCG2678892.1 hypothetical protein [Kiritimatiellia bacterium]
DRSAIPLYAQGREARRRPKIAAAFFEPNSTHCWENGILGLRAQARVSLWPGWIIQLAYFGFTWRAALHKAGAPAGPQCYPSADGL